MSIAHAGGGFESQTYTNSIDALEANKKKFLLFELDFFVTEDNKVAVSYTHLRAHETKANLVCRLLLEKKKKQ